MGKVVRFIHPRKKRPTGQHPGALVLPWLLVLALVIGATAGYFIFDLQTNSHGEVASAEAIVGRASVIDGDTLEIHGTRIRLHGIDAPESGQLCSVKGTKSRCGQLAALALADKIGNHTVSCEPRDRDRYNRVVAVCRADGEDLNAWMVSEGWAMAYRHYSTDYVQQEENAATSKIGIWQGDFVAPWVWRRGKRLEANEVQQPGNCLIKGNISRSGEHIYHVPGGQYYDRTRIDTLKAERWFCSEAEARTAGWRRSRR